MCLDGARWTLILTTCLESLSTCPRWCSLSHRHVLSSMQCTLRLDRTTNNHMEHLPWTRVTCLRPTGLAAVKCSSQVGVDHSFPSFGGHVLRWAGELTSTIVYQKVYSAMLLQHRWHEGFYLPHTGNQNKTAQWNELIVKWFWGLTA